MRGNPVASSLRSDGWDGYPASLHRLLAGVFKRGANDVVFLSGNEHLSSVTTIEISKLDDPKSVVVAHSVHSSGLYTPFPFANAIEEDFAGTEEFEFSHEGTSYRCGVTTWFAPPGDGFAVLSISAVESAWTVSVRFDREKNAPADANTTREFRIERAERVIGLDSANPPSGPSPAPPSSPAAAHPAAAPPPATEQTHQVFPK